VKSMRRALGAVALAVASIGPMATMAAPVDAAATTNVWVIYPKWKGNCARGGSVSRIYSAVDNIWSTPPTGDNGDDIIYPRVRYGWNTISTTIFCKTSWFGAGYWQPGMQHRIYVSRPGQNFFLGPV
jgi:hypothetical protein